MPVYYINSYDITNEAEFSKYPPLIRSILAKYGAEVIIADVEAICIEGSMKKMNAVIKFPSEEYAMDFYNDPEYQCAKEIRLNSTTNSTIVLAKEWVKQA